MVLPLPLLVWPLVLAPAPVPTGALASPPAERFPAPAPSGRLDAITDLERLARRLERRRGALDVEGLRELDAALAALTEQLALEPERRPGAADALLELVEAAEALAEQPDFGPSVSAARPLERARSALRALLKGSGGAETARFLAEDVLRDATRRKPEQRRIAAWVLGEVRHDVALPALLATARDADEDAALVQAAQGALVGWADPRVHQAFLDLFEARRSVRLAAEHFLRLGPDLGPQALDRLRAVTGRFYVAEDWRDAARARAVVEALDAARAAPVLIEALAVWSRRAQRAEGSRRILEEIVLELRRLSGRNLGRDPALWNRWWGDVLSGTTLLPDEAAARGTPITTATFFGLRLASDRVLFVVDRSGSMDEEFGTGGRSRYEEAVDQLFRFLEGAGPSTRFGLALFHDDADMWRTGKLLEADESACRQARRWLDGKRPGGGTALRAGLFDALGADRDGNVEPARVEADTLVILCDGATSSGPGWVADWLTRTGEDLQLVVHGVQIGSHGDGTLEALADGTGGSFVRIER